MTTFSYRASNRVRRQVVAVDAVGWINWAENPTEVYLFV